ncbi:hypothetical protein ACLOJK_004484, partial [Asimina triloba]
MIGHGNRQHIIFCDGQQPPTSRPTSSSQGRSHPSNGQRSNRGHEDHCRRPPFFWPGAEQPAATHHQQQTASKSGQPWSRAKKKTHPFDRHHHRPKSGRLSQVAGVLKPIRSKQRAAMNF